MPKKAKKCWCYKCGHKWDYKGKSKILAPCSMCGTKVFFSKMEKELKKLKNGKSRRI